MSDQNSGQPFENPPQPPGGNQQVPQPPIGGYQPQPPPPPGDFQPQPPPPTGGYQPPAAGFQQTPPPLLGGIPPEVTNSLKPDFDYTASFSQAEIEEGKAMSIIGYLGILFLIPMLALPNNRFARFHANQGLVLFIFWVVVGVAIQVLGYVPIIRYFTWVLSFIPLVLMILGMVNAGGGKAKTLPVIGNIQLIK